MNRKALMRTAAIWIALIGMLGLCGSCGGPPHPRVTLRLETGERIVLELYPEKAPNTANNFLCLADSGFYTGKVFSRSLGGYLIACDSRDAQGAQADIGYRIPGEFSQAGFAQNDLAHEAGVVTMARENARYGYPPEDSYDTAGSGFMILSAASPRMDGLYAAFGRVISGMDAVDKIAAGPTVGEQLAKPVEIRSAEVNYRGYQPQAPVKAEPWGKRGVIKLGAGGTGCTKAAAPSTGISSN